jgi:hypothetical protein
MRQRHFRKIRTGRQKRRQPLERGGFDAAFPVLRFEEQGHKEWESGVKAAALHIAPSSGCCI